MHGQQELIPNFWLNLYAKIPVVMPTIAGRTLTPYDCLTEDEKDALAEKNLYPETEAIKKKRAICKRKIENFIANRKYIDLLTVVEEQEKTAQEKAIDSKLREIYQKYDALYKFFLIDKENKNISDARKFFHEEQGTGKKEIIEAIMRGIEEINHELALLQERVNKLTKEVKELEKEVEKLEVERTALDNQFKNHIQKMIAKLKSGELLGDYQNVVHVEPLAEELSKIMNEFLHHKISSNRIKPLVKEAFLNNIRDAKKFDKRGASPKALADLFVTKVFKDLGEEWFKRYREIDFEIQFKKNMMAGKKREIKITQDRMEKLKDIKKMQEAVKNKILGYNEQANQPVKERMVDDIPGGPSIPRDVESDHTRSAHIETKAMLNSSVKLIQQAIEAKSNKEEKMANNELPQENKPVIADAEMKKPGSQIAKEALADTQLHIELINQEIREVVSEINYTADKKDTFDSTEKGTLIEKYKTLSSDEEDENKDNNDRPKPSAPHANDAKFFNKPQQEKQNKPANDDEFNDEQERPRRGMR